MRLKPTEIFYSQDSINNVFDKRCAYSYKPIGQTLDALCEGRSQISSIPNITVVWQDGKWVTADNRRLWVFREMERLGKCEDIPVYQGYSIPSAKMTSYNGGVSVHVRGSPGGFWHNKPSASKPKPKPAVTASIRSNTSTSNTYNANSSIHREQLDNRYNAYTSNASSGQFILPPHDHADTSRSNLSGYSHNVPIRQDRITPIVRQDSYQQPSPTPIRLSSVGLHTKPRNSRLETNETKVDIPTVANLSWTDETTSRHRTKQTDDIITLSPRQHVSTRNHSTYKVQSDVWNEPKDKGCCIIL